jgi:hypothetical protein
MAKKRKKRKGRSKAPTQPPATPPGKWKRLFQTLSSPIGILVSSASFVSLIAGAYTTLRPKLSLESDSPLKAESVISNTFRLTNEGILAIYNVKPQWLIEKRRAYMLDGSPSLWEVGSIDETRPDQIFPKLGGSQSITVYPFEHVCYSSVTLKHTKMLVIIDYELPIIHWKMTKSFFFEGDEGTDGSFHWYHTSKPPVAGSHDMDKEELF